MTEKCLRVKLAVRMSNPFLHPSTHILTLSENDYHFVCICSHCLGKFIIVFVSFIIGFIAVGILLY